MEVDNTYEPKGFCGTSRLAADQSENTLNPPSAAYVSSDQQNQHQKGSTAAKYKQKVGEGLRKTKTAGSHGFNKVKEGTSVGFHKVKEGTTLSFQWMKAKYQKATQKH